jgi:L-2-hydroxyglutarate oxidase
MIDGSVTVGPNAVLGFAREKYQRFGFDPRDTADWIAFPGLWRTLARHWRSAAVEMRNSLWRGGYLAECRKYCPSLTIADLHPYPAGIRAQAVMADGALAHDFLFVESDRQLHVCNAPSPRGDLGETDRRNGSGKAVESALENRRMPGCRKVFGASGWDPPQRDLIR